MFYIVCLVASLCACVFVCFVWLTGCLIVVVFVCVFVCCVLIVRLSGCFECLCCLFVLWFDVFVCFARVFVCACLSCVFFFVCLMI